MSEDIAFGECPICGEFTDILIHDDGMRECLECGGRWFEGGGGGKDYDDYDDPFGGTAGYSAPTLY